MVKLTDGLARRIEVPEDKKEVFVFDETLPGFFLRKFASGEASYGVKYSIGKKQRRIRLADALQPRQCEKSRREAAAILADAHRGIDERGRREEKRRAEEAAARVVTTGSLINAFLAARKERFSAAWYVEAKRYLCGSAKNEAVGSFKELHPISIEALSRAHIVKALDCVEAASGSVSADRAKQALSSFLAWVVERGYRETNPVDGIRKRASGAARERVLSEAELAAIWNACPADDFSAIVRLLILTGQRRGEIANLNWQEINFEKVQIELPGSRTKNGRPHTIPLSAHALAILKALMRREGRSYVFGNGAKGGFQGWSNCKDRLDAELPADMPAWTLHDIRRSVVTHLSERGFAQPHVCEAIINHISGHKAGVAGVYNRAAYAAEKRRALELWADHLHPLIESTESPKQARIL